MAETLKVVVVGSVAAGPKVASKVAPLRPGADKPAVTLCKVSLRGYEVAVTLKHAGFRRKIVVPLRLNSAMSPRTWRALATSMPVVGSSRKRIGGRWIIPAAMVSRRFIPLE
jgi:hypothetical protein